MLWTTLVSEVSIPIAPPTAADPSAAAASASLLVSPAEKKTASEVYKVRRDSLLGDMNPPPPLTLLFLLLLDLCGEFCGAGDPQRRLCLLYDLSQALA